MIENMKPRLLACLLALSVLPAAAAAKKDSFTVSFYRAMAKQASNENLLVSPFSLHTALTMTYTGAAGRTRAEMGSTLGLAGQTDAKLSQAYKKILASLGSIGNTTQLDIASGLFANSRYKLKQQFLDRGKLSFGAGLQSLDFASPRTAGIINQWALDKTHGKIDKVIERTISTDALCLVNAVYFKGTWLKEFPLRHSEEDDFNLQDGSVKKVMFMRLKDGAFRYQKQNAFQAVKLPYLDGRTALYIFLPSKNLSLSQLESRLTDGNLRSWMTGFYDRPGVLRLPRFRMENAHKLNSVLSGLGMPLAFTRGKADFSLMADPSNEIYISSVFQKSFIDVNEKGTEAAAATSVLMGGKGLFEKPPEPFYMVVDRPFLFILRDDRTGATLFMGHIVDPES